MKDKHNVILILVLSCELNSLFRRLINSWFQLFHLLFFSEFQPVFNYFTTEIHLNRYKDSPCVFNFSFLSFDHPFVTGVSSWRLCMVVHQGFNSFSKCSSRFFSKELKHSSSCIPKWNSFTLSFEVVLCHLWQFPSCFMIQKLEWDI